MEAQGMNLFSLLPGMSMATTEKTVLPGISTPAFTGSEFSFSDIFSQFTAQRQDESTNNIDGEAVVPVTFSENIRQSPAQLATSLLPVEPSRHHLLPDILPARQILQGEQPKEGTSEALSVRENAGQFSQIPKESEKITFTFNNDLKAPLTSESKTSEVVARKTKVDISNYSSSGKTMSLEQGMAPDSNQSPKIKQNVLPVTETFADKPVTQNPTLAQSMASEIVQLSKVNERKAFAPVVQSGIPVMTTTVEPPAAVESLKPVVTETVSQPVIKQPASAPEVPLNRLGQTLIQMISKGEQKLEFRLDPPELGKLTMTVAMERDSVSVQMITGSQTVKDLLLLQADRLRTALADESLTLEQMSVDVGRQGSHDHRSATTSETLWLADAGSESGGFQAASVMFKAQGGRLLDHFV